MKKLYIVGMKLKAGSRPNKIKLIKTIRSMFPSMGLKETKLWVEEHLLVQDGHIDGPRSPYKWRVKETSTFLALSEESAANVFLQVAVHNSTIDDRFGNETIEAWVVQELRNIARVEGAWVSN